MGYADTMDKYIPETEWVAAQYGTFWTWMGQGKGWTDDGQMLARIYNAMIQTQATELLLNLSHDIGLVNDSDYSKLGPYRVNGEDGLLLQAKKYVWEAQVTDTTGISPRIYEFWYGMNKTHDALTICDSIIYNITSRSGSPFAGNVQINPYTLDVHNETSGFINATTLAGGLTINDVETTFDIAITTEQIAEYETLYPVQTAINHLNLSAPGWSQDYYQLLFDFRGYYDLDFSNHSDGTYFNETEIQSTKTAGDNNSK